MIITKVRWYLNYVTILLELRLIIKSVYRSIQLILVELAITCQVQSLLLVHRLREEIGLS